MTGGFNFRPGHHAPPVDYAAAAIFMIIPLGNDHACITHLQHNYGVGIVVHPQDIPDLHVRKSNG